MSGNNPTREEANQIAETIYRQIPTMDRMAVGARDFTRDENGNITFKVMTKPYRFISIVLDPSDTYTVTYFKIKRGSWEKVILKEYDTIYCDMLGDTIYRMTLEN